MPDSSQGNGERQEPAKDERSAERVVVDLGVDASVGDRACRLVVFDLSTDGCKVEAESDSFVLGIAVAFTLPGGHAVTGRVIWALERYAGVVFDQPLHHAVVAHLGFKPAAEPLDFRDRFGRPLPGRLRQSGSEPSLDRSKDTPKAS